MLIPLFTSLISCCLLFILEISIAHYTGYFPLFMLTSFLIISLFIDSLTYFSLIPIIFIGFESLLFHDSFLLAFYWIIPTIFLAIFLKNKMLTPFLTATITLIFCMLLHFIIVLLYSYNLPLSYYTVLQIGVNLLFILISLKYLPTVK